MSVDILQHFLTEWSYWQLLLLFILIAGYSVLAAFFGDLFTEKKMLLYFSSLITGFVLLTTIFSVIKTSFSTVLIIFVIPIFFLTKKYWKQSANVQFLKTSSRWMLQVFLYTLPVSTIFFTFQFFTTYQSDTEFIYKIQNWDYTYYYSFIEPLRHMGIENSNGIANFFDPAWHGNTAYHYSELWLAALSGTLFSVNSMISFKLFTFTFFQFSFFTGLLAFCEKRYTVSWKSFLICLFVLFAGGIYLQWYAIVPNLEAVKYLADNHLMGYGNIKYGPIYVFFLAILIALNYRQYYLAWILLHTVPILFISTWPAIAGGTFLFAVWYWYKNRLDKIFFQYAFVPVALYIALGFFYFLTGTNENNSVNSWDDLLPVFVSGMEWRTMLVFLLKKIIVVFLFFPFKCFLTYVFWIILLILLWKRTKWFKNILIQNISFFVLVVCILFSGLVAFLLWYINIDAMQMFTNVVFPLFNVALSLVCIMIFCSPEKGWLVKVLPAMYLVFSMVNQSEVISKEYTRYNIYSDEYLTQIDKWSEELPPLSKGAFIAGSDFFEGDNLFLRKPTLNILGNYITYTHLVLPVSLSIYDTPEGKTPEEKVNIKRYKQSSVFYRYTEQNEFSDLDAAKTVFVLDHKLRYLIVGKGGEVPNGLKDHILKQTTDPLSGEMFFVLKE